MSLNLPCTIIFSAMTVISPIEICADEPRKNPFGDMVKSVKEAARELPNIEEAQDSEAVTEEGATSDSVQEPSGTSIQTSIEFQDTHRYYQQAMTELRQAMSNDRAYIHSRRNPENADMEDGLIRSLDAHQSTLDRLEVRYSNNGDIQNYLSGTRPANRQNEYYDDRWQDDLRRWAEPEMSYIAQDMRQLFRDYQNFQKYQVQKL